MGSLSARLFSRRQRRVVFGLRRSTWRVMSSQISLCTAELTRLSTSTQLSTIHSGASKCRPLDLPWGAFGENFSTLGLLEETIRIGDRLRVGSAEFVVTQPRMPCFKLGIRFGRPEMVKRFLNSGRTGFYLAVLREGRVTARDSIELLVRDDHGVTVADIVNLYAADAMNQDLFAPRERGTRASHRLARPLSQTPLGPG